MNAQMGNRERESPMGWNGDLSWPQRLLRIHFLTKMGHSESLWGARYCFPNFRFPSLHFTFSQIHVTSQVALAVKNPSANAGDMGLIPALGRSPGGGHGNPLQYSCLENPIDRGAWWAMVHRIAKSRTRPKQLSTCHFTYLSNESTRELTKQKEAHRLREQTYRCQWGKLGGRDS